MNVIQKAAQFADNAHRGQTRKFSGHPYIGHPMRVAGKVTLIPDMTEEHIAAAWLHDVVEDTPFTITDIQDVFGHTIASYVRYLTNPSKERPELNRAARKQIDRDYLSSAPLLIRAIKVIDRMDNLADTMVSSCMFGGPAKFLKLYKRESVDLLLAIIKSDDPDWMQELGETAFGLTDSCDEFAG